MIVHTGMGDASHRHGGGAGHGPIAVVGFFTMGHLGDSARG